MVLKYVNGGNLRDYLRDNFKNDEYKLKFVEQIYCAKDLAHGLGFLRKESDLMLGYIYKNRPQVNEVDDIVNNIKSEAVKKFNKNIIKVEQRTNNSSEPVVTNKRIISLDLIIIAKLPQEFIKLYIKDMVTNSDDTATDVNSWLKITVKFQKKKFDFTMNFEAEHHETILAYFYMKGFGTNKDYRECLQWCKKGCEKKDIYAYYELRQIVEFLTTKREFAIMYMDGMGCEENKTKASCLFGDQDKMASCIISDWYYDGIGAETDLVEGISK
ncbi:6080_t:CDS:2 [Gigaspora rosea]|nr:6080_t:CDS:2 [Gigaspora rosea]